MIVLECVRGRVTPYQRRIGRFAQARSGPRQRFVHSPHLLDVEVANALRRLVGLRALPAGRYSHVPYSGRSFARLVGQAVLPAAAFQAASTGTWHAGRTSRGEQI